MELLSSLADSETLKSFMNDAASSQFTHTLLIFCAAAFVHAKQVSKEIKRQFSELVGVVRDDLKAQQVMIAAVKDRVTIIESKITKEKL